MPRQRIRINYSMNPFMVWFSALLFGAVGIVLIIRRVPIARGESLVMGGKVPVGCVVIQGILAFAIGALFFIASELGWFG